MSYTLVNIHTVIYVYVRYRSLPVKIDGNTPPFKGKIKDQPEWYLRLPLVNGTWAWLLTGVSKKKRYIIISSTTSKTKALSETNNASHVEYSEIRHN